MKLRNRIVLAITSIVFLVVACFAFTQLSGCTAAQTAALQKEAADVRYVTATPGTVANPSTQPSTAAALDTTQAVVQVAGDTSPWAKLVIGIIGAIAGAVVAAPVASTVTANNAKSVLTEVATAATGFLPGPWSSIAQQKLSAAGLHDVAATASPTASTPSPTPAPASNSAAPAPAVT